MAKHKNPQRIARRVVRLMVVIPDVVVPEYPILRIIREDQILETNYLETGMPPLNGGAYLQ